MKNSDTRAARYFSLRISRDLSCLKIVISPFSRYNETDNTLMKIKICIWILHPSTHPTTDISSPASKNTLHLRGNRNSHSISLCCSFYRIAWIQSKTIGSCYRFPCLLKWSTEPSSSDIKRNGGMEVPISALITYPRLRWWRPKLVLAEIRTRDIHLMFGWSVDESGRMMPDWQSSIRKIRYCRRWNSICGGWMQFFQRWQVSILLLA